MMVEPYDGLYAVITKEKTELSEVMMLTTFA